MKIKVVRKMEDSLKEHQVIAHCVAYLLGEKKYDIRKIAVKKKHHEEVRETIRFVMVEFWDIDEKEVDQMVNKISFNERNPWDIEGYYKTKEKIQRKIVIEAKGGKKVYGIYTLIGQIICNLEKNSDYTWIGIACPASWMKAFHEKMTHQSKAKPLIDLILKNKDSFALQFCFIDDVGYPLDISWKEFIEKGETYFK